MWPKTPRPAAACPLSCQRHRKFNRPIRSGRLLPAAVGELIVWRENTYDSLFGPSRAEQADKVTAIFGVAVEPDG